MRFVIRTTYDRKALTVMARTLRKTLRRKSGRRSAVFGMVVVILAGLLLFAKLRSGEGFDGGDWVTLAMVLLIIVTFFAQDALNGWLAGRKMLPGTEQGETVFSDEQKSYAKDSQNDIADRPL